MTDSIFAGKLSLTDDIPEKHPWDNPDADLAAEIREVMHSVAGIPRAQAEAAAAERLKRRRETWHGTPQFEALPEPVNESAMRVRAEAQRLGIDYDGEVAKILHGMKGDRPYTRSPLDPKPGPDPLKNITPWDLARAEGVYAEQLSRFYGIR